VIFSIDDDHAEDRLKYSTHTTPIVVTIDGALDDYRQRRCPPREAMLVTIRRQDRYARQRSS
jgi:hypothetical protein